MRVLLLGILMCFISVCMAEPLNPPIDHHPHFYYNFPIDPNAGLKCHQSHRSGHYYYRCNGTYFPDYQGAQFYMTQKYRPWYRFPFSVNQYRGKKVGFYRCYSPEGLSLECYDHAT